MSVISCTLYISSQTVHVFTPHSSVHSSPNPHQLPVKGHKRHHRLIFPAPEMSTFASAQLDSSDDEADTDFIPTAPKSAPNGKGSSSKRKASSHHSLNLKIVRSSKLAKRRIPKGSDDQAGDDAEGPDESSAESSSDSEDEEADGDELDEEREAKRRRLQEEEEGRKKRAREAFASFANPSPESSVKETGESSTDTGAGAGVNGLVEVRRPRQFAGETI